MSRTAAWPGRLVLLGHPVGHSRSPAFQNAALEAAGIPLRYTALDVAPAELGQVLADLRAVRGAGNVTIPHKRAVYEACEVRLPRAEQAGAVNTFWHDEEGRLYGDNTDVAGFEAAVDSLGTTRPGAVVALLGAGGAAAGVCAAVATWAGATVGIFARSPERANELRQRFPHTRPASSAAAALSGASLVVNATPVGMTDDAHPVEVAWLPRDAHVMDLVYRDGETSWVRAARARGLRAIDGRAMLLSQGAEAFRCWFGRDPDLEVMRTALGHSTRSE
ncbi:MAG: shikimate dehydrogenase [Gemmatimonadaceae bacterium]|nr:shikimate dehydrogenase [Gemmatimonadaceae bacterium]